MSAGNNGKGGSLAQEDFSATKMFDRRKSPDDPITRADMGTLIDALNDRFDAGNKRMDDQDAVLARVETALFYKPVDEKDETPPGIVPVLRKIDSHVDMVCGLAKFGARALSWGTPIACAIIGVIGQFKGWW